jgi:membrane-bound lytic murein transglycosylase D
MMKNSIERLALAGLLLFSAAGCASDAGRQDTAARAAAEPAVVAPALSVDAFSDRIAALHELRASGDGERFAGARDSLVADVNQYIRSHPHAENDPVFAGLLNSLSALDTLATDTLIEDAEFTIAEDSLARANSWESSGVHAAPRFTSGESAFPVIDNSRVDFWITYFTGPGRERFGRALYRMELHRPAIEPILDEMGLPQELIVIAFIESGFALRAVSTASAVGPWQFIKGTAKRYGLRVNWWYDERCDIVASTWAAGNYLRDLHGIWGDWFLAFAAYNCGEYRVARQVARQKTQDFWALDLPLQTERYVPKFLAALYIMRDPQKYGFTIPAVEPIRYDRITVTEATELGVLARAAGTTTEVIKELNPALRRGATPPNMEIHVMVPEGAGEVCEATLAAMPARERARWSEHKVHKGETLSQIAGKYGTSVEALRDTNGLKKRSTLQIGQILMIPGAGGGASPDLANSRPSYMESRGTIDREALERYAQRASTRYTAPAGKSKTVYTVRKNDTLGEIARRYGTSAAKIRSWNNLSPRKHIYPGQKLAIYTSSPAREELSPGASASVAAVDESRFEKTKHTVARGETFYSISRQYSVSMQDLMSWNGRSRSTLRAGDVLVIYRPGGGSVGGQAR